MKKFMELNNPKSCLNKAYSDEMLFILLERDKAAPKTIRAWIAERISLGLNKYGDKQIEEARKCAEFMEAPIDSK